MTWIAIALPAATALILSLAGPALAIPFLRRAGIVDVPSARSAHSHVAVRGVGVVTAVSALVGLALGAILLSTSDAHERIGYIAAVAVSLAAIGLRDDLGGLRVTWRLAFQGAVALTAGLSLVWVFEIHLLWALVAALLIIACTNVVNFMDGVDGITAFHGVLVGVAFVVLGVTFAVPWLVLAGAVLVASSAGFIPWNLGRPGTFGGDVGTYFLGGFISSTALLAVLHGVPEVIVIAPLTVYLADTATTLARRIATGQEWHRSHRSHGFQRLEARGFSHVVVAGVVVGFSTVAILAALSLELLLGATVLAFAALALVAVIYLITVALMLRSRPASTPKSPPESLLPSRAGSAEWNRWAVVGASGFIGTHLVEALESHDHSVVEVVAPRLRSRRLERSRELVELAQAHREVITELAAQLVGVEIVVNAAGLATPAAPESDEMTGANALLPVIVCLAATEAGALRVIHLSSAASQGRRAVLDESAETEPFSPYSLSKSDGEQALMSWVEEQVEGAPEVIIVRATSVHGAGTAKLDSLRRVASTRVASVAGAGDSSTILSSVDEFVRFVEWVGRWPTDVPTIVLQPDEGLSTGEVLQIASGRVPRQLPTWFCRMALMGAYTVAAFAPSLRARVRRVELMWVGQRMAPTWASKNGWKPSDALRDMLAEADVSPGSARRVAPTDVGVKKEQR